MSKQGQILLAYLPVTKLKHISNNSARSRIQANLFHGCMRYILRDTIKPALKGVQMQSGDGVVRKFFPIFAIHVGDYPEQVQCTCVKSRKCPTCKVAKGRLGFWIESTLSNPTLYDLEKIIEVMNDPNHDDWPKRCEKLGIRPVYKPYWRDLPYADPFLSITPDILHQVYQGMLKHLIQWLRQAYGDAEIDARCRRLPPNHHIRIFSNGFTALSRLTGREHADIARIILGIIVDLPLKIKSPHSPERIVKAVRALLDFAYLAQYPVHSDQSLDEMVNALYRFHQNKRIFIDLKIRTDFEFNKLHSYLHYKFMIQRYGTTDNYNTEHTERLHIPYAKDAFSATNSKNEYPQMTRWIERKEKIMNHEKYIQWCLNGKPPLVSIYPTETLPKLNMTKFPSAKAVSFDILNQAYTATMFKHALTHFIIQRQNPDMSYAEVERYVPSRTLLFNKVPVYHKAKFWLGHKETFRLQSDEYDVLHVHPPHKGTDKTIIPGRFDTALVNMGYGEHIGVDGYRVAQVKVIFSLPKNTGLFAPTTHIPQYLAYVEWFSSFRSNTDTSHLLYEIERAYNNQGNPIASIIPLQNISRSIHLFPHFDFPVSRKWASETVLNDSERFYVNNFTDRHSFHTIL